MTDRDLPTRSTVTVIGAGPAGALTALLLAQRGINVLLLEKNSFPRMKVCGCCLSATSLEVMDACGLGALPAELKAVEHKRLSVHTEKHRLHFPLTRSVSVSRSALDAALVERAQKSGVQFFCQCAAQITGSDASGVTIVVTGPQGKVQLRTKIAVVADGLGGTALSPSLGLDIIGTANSRVGTAAVSNDISLIAPDTIHMSYARGGYVGMVRLEDDSVDIAAAIDVPFLKRHRSPAAAARAILQAANFPLPEDLDSITWRGTVPLTQRRRHVAARRIFVVGDSASYIEPFTGEGIAWALTCAVLVTPLVERGALIWHPTLAAEWMALYEKNIRVNQNETSAIAWLLKHQVLSNFAAALLERSPNLGKIVAQTITAPKLKTGAARCQRQ